MVTGRLLHEIREICDGIELFDAVVAENGAVVWTEDRGTRTMAPPVPLDLVAGLRRRGVTPLIVGSVICSTWSDHEVAVIDTIEELGLDVELSHNKGALMMLPGGIDKSVGFKTAVQWLRERPDGAVAVGDGENDLPLLGAAGCGAAVGNALDSVKAAAAVVLVRDHGEGVEDLIDAMVDDDLATLLRTNERAG
jgi:hydroxymethylpyrimidine pyrophosphatase-like HAD family hydrolase